MSEPSEVILPIFGILDVTGEVVVMWIIVAVIAVLSLLVTRNLQERPGRLQNLVEMGIETLDHFFVGLLGPARARKYMFFLGTLFVFILFANYSGLFPGVGLTKYLKAPTSSLSVTAALGGMTFLFLQIAGIRERGLGGYLKHFWNPVIILPILLILDEFIKPLSLALRLFGNIFGEETVTEQLYELLPIGAPLIMMILSLLFCFIQAVVFTMLTSIYLDEALGEEE